MVLGNAFSLNMLDPALQEATLRCQRLSLERAQQIAREAGELVSAVGHADTAAILEDMLGVPVPPSRKTVALRPGDRVLVGQYRGPRLPEGARELPPGAEIVFYLVEVS